MIRLIRKYNKQVREGLISLSILLTLMSLPLFGQYTSVAEEISNASDHDSIVTLVKPESVNPNSIDPTITSFNSKIFTSKNTVGSFTKEDPKESVHVNHIKKEDVKVVPGGQSIGVQLHTTGVLVVGHHLVNGQDGGKSPGELAKVKIGDIILKINNEKIHKMDDVKPYVEKAGKENETINLTIQRGKETFETTLKPLMDSKDNKYRIGLYIRDSAAGIGTMSFFDPDSGRYGALGHVISDMDTQKPIEIHEGNIVRSTVTSIEKGNQGTPGEKRANFSVNENKIGSITKNSPFGIFGQLNHSIKNGKYDQPMNVSLPHEVKQGPAKILTVIDGETVEAFDVEITSTLLQNEPATKGMVIKVTDPKLLKRTGGIVQGMSGSPIIQGDKIIGAVTHVFVNDPTSGYGVHIQWMLQEIGVKIDKEFNQAS